MPLKSIILGSFGHSFLYTFLGQVYVHNFIYILLALFSSVVIFCLDFILPWFYGSLFYYYYFVQMNFF